MTNLTSISTYGWFTGGAAGENIPDKLEPLSTYGWWLTVVIFGTPDLIEFDLYVKESDSRDMYVKKSAEWPLER